MSNLEERFSKVFHHNLWNSDESRSGVGSNLSAPEVRLSIDFIEYLIRDYAVRDINDVPCGDFNWMPLILGRHRSLVYRGFDVVSDIIAQNRNRFPDYSFTSFDATKQILPPADLIFSKDMLEHLPDMLVIETLRNFKLSKSRYLVCSSHRRHDNLPSAAMDNGDYRFLNLSAAPFSMPQPLWSNHYLSLWSLDMIPLTLFDEMAYRVEKFSTPG